MYGALQRVATRHSVLRVCYSAFRHVTGVSQRVRACHKSYNAVRACDSVLQRVTGVLPRITGCYIALRERYRVLQRVAVCGGRVTVRYCTLQHVTGV